MFNIVNTALPYISAIAQFFAHPVLALNYHVLSIAYLKRKS